MVASRLAAFALNLHQFFPGKLIPTNYTGTRPAVGRDTYSGIENGSGVPDNHWSTGTIQGEE